MQTNKTQKNKTLNLPRLINLLCWRNFYCWTEDIEVHANRRWKIEKLKTGEWICLNFSISCLFWHVSFVFYLHDCICLLTIILVIKKCKKMVYDTWSRKLHKSGSYINKIVVNVPPYYKHNFTNLTEHNKFWETCRFFNRERTVYFNSVKNVLQMFTYNTLTVLLSINNTIGKVQRRYLRTLCSS